MEGEDFNLIFLRTQPLGSFGELNVTRSASSYLMFAEDGDQVGISFGLQGVWKRLVAGRSLDEEEEEEEETTHQASTEPARASTTAKCSECWQKTQRAHTLRRTAPPPLLR